MTATLAKAIESSAVSFKDLEQEYRPMLAMVNELIGVVPNCDTVLEIWPPGFRTYNLFVPNLLNLPVSLFGQGAPKALVGLAMYASSRAAECMYCSAHTCSFALRRGATPETITGTYTDADRAVVSLAEAMSSVPAYLDRGHIDELLRHVNRDQMEWIVLSVAMMGFLNKFMDTMGIELEDSAIADVEALIGPTGWKVGKHGWSTEADSELLEGLPLRPPPGDTPDNSLGGRILVATRPEVSTSNDNGNSNSNGNGEVRSTVPVDSLSTYLRVLRNAPGAIRRERRWTRGLSTRSGSTLLALEDQVGYSFPVLASLRQGRVIKAIAAALRENLNPELSAVGLDSKILAGLVYARVVGDELLTADAVQLAEALAPNLSPTLLASVSRFAETNASTAVLPPGLTKIQAASIITAKAGSPSPSEVNEITISVATDALDAAQVVEIVTWLSVQQLMHRLYVYYEALAGVR